MTIPIRLSFLFSVLLALVAVGNTATATENTTFLYVRVETANVRTGPGKEFPVRYQVSRGARVAPTEQKRRGWLQITRHHDTQSGWIHESLVTKEPPRSAHSEPGVSKAQNRGGADLGVARSRVATVLESPGDVVLDRRSDTRWIYGSEARIIELEGNRDVLTKVRMTAVCGRDPLQAMLAMNTLVMLGNAVRPGGGDWLLTQIEPLKPHVDLPCERVRTIRKAKFTLRVTGDARKQRFRLTITPTGSS